MLRFDLLHFAAGACFIVVATFLGGAFYASLGSSSKIELGTVSGRVTFHGRPQPNLCIDFVPAGGGRGSEGRTNQQGHYQAIYSLDKAGVLVGLQEVLICVPEVLDHANNPVIPRRILYSADVEIHEGQNQLDFDLANWQATNSHRLTDVAPVRAE
ncbi:MAG TPA: hypothetical protein VMJ32_18265 [Pirellulales bacterium]|nr:hypothetical protein [Pirellulales bacterium]